MSRFSDRMKGCLLGLAVGDALGLPAEGLSRRRVNRWFGSPWSHHFLFGHGMISDDTEHALFVCQSLLEEDATAGRFARRLARRLRWWFLCLPAGVGMATLRSCMKLCVGWSPEKSGVYSAGNGPAMRAPVLGLYFRDDPDQMAAFVRASTIMTHTDSKAYTGALAIAKISAMAGSMDVGNHLPVEDILDSLKACGPSDQEWLTIIECMAEHSEKTASVEAFANKLGLSNGVTGYMYHTVPVAIYSWMRHFGDYRMSLDSVLNLGGDTDTVGAITGALAGATVGESGIPQDWIDGICDWPRSVGMLRELATAIAGKDHGRSEKAIPHAWPFIPFRNLFFLVVVLLHGFRRLLPPY